MAKKSLKDQLMEAGFRSNKMENHRSSAKGREVKQSEKHQVTRNYCEHCGLIHPDVERYKHNMPTTEAEWICLACVDKLMIDDRFRTTNQSDMAKRGMFRRYFGQTKDFSKVDQGGHGNRGPRRDRDGNRSGKNHQRRGEGSRGGQRSHGHKSRRHGHSDGRKGNDGNGEVNGNK